jgi:hypothetical protein
MHPSRPIAIALATSLAACGAERIPTEPDADVVAARVVVSVTENGAAAPGKQVYFQNADSSLVGSATTDADGAASAVMGSGGFVTVVEPSAPTSAPAGAAAGAPVLATFAGVQPADVLSVDLGNDDVAPAPTVVDLTVPLDPAPLVSYQLYASCGNTDVDADPPTIAPGGGAVQVALPGCVGGVADFLVVTFATTGQALDYLYEPGVYIGDSTGSGTVVELHGTYAPIATVSEAFTSFPADQPAATAVGLSTRRGPLYQATATAAGSAGAPMLVVPPVADATATTDVYATSVDDTQEIVSWSPGPATRQSIDFTQVQLVDVATPPAYDAGTHALTWSVGSVGRDPDFAFAAVTVARPPVQSGAPVAPPWTWQVVGPAEDSGDVAFPVLPVDGFDYNVHAGDATTPVAAGGAIVPGGYDAARGVFYGPHGLAPVVRASIAGQLVLETYDASGSAGAPAFASVDLRRLWRYRNARATSSR